MGLRANTRRLKKNKKKKSSVLGIMKLRPREEIEAHFSKQGHIPFLVKVAKGQAKSEVRRFLLKAAFGRHVFRGATGRALLALAEGRMHPMQKKPAILNVLNPMYAQLAWTINSNSFEHISVTEEERFVLSHELKNAVQNIKNLLFLARRKSKRVKKV